MTPIEIAQEEWTKPVVDNGEPASNAQILQYIWRVRPDVKQHSPNTFPWCGAFAAFCYQGIRPWLLQHFFASTYRLDCYGRGEPVVMEGPNGEPISWDPGKDQDRLYAQLDEHTSALPDWVGPNDIALVGTHDYGSHVTLIQTVRDFDGLPRQVGQCLGGNQTGILPGHKFGRGVSGHDFCVGRVYEKPYVTMHIRRVIRPAPGDWLS